MRRPHTPGRDSRSRDCPATNRNGRRPSRPVDSAAERTAQAGRHGPRTRRSSPGRYKCGPFYRGTRPRFPRGCWAEWCPGSRSCSSHGTSRSSRGCSCHLEEGYSQGGCLCSRVRSCQGGRC
ncbi:MAG: hypothetical protein ACK55Z_21120, partial [bacterium]